MIEKMNDHNMINVFGKIVGTPDYSHSVGAERFIKGNIRVLRMSGQTDTLPFIVSERLPPSRTLEDGDTVMLTGQLRSHDAWFGPNGKSHLEIVIFVRDIIYVINPDDEIYTTKNEVMLTGRLCRPPVYRVTHFRREICDLMIAAHRAYGKTDYIPCIAWGRNARYISDQLKVGDTLRIKGRFQSRDYQKKLESGVYEGRTSYEVSIFELLD